MDDQNKQVVIEYFANLDDTMLEPMVGAFQDAGVSVRVMRDSSHGSQGSQGPLAMLPTAVQVLVPIGIAFGTKLLDEMAKDAYSGLKRGFAALWKNLRHDPGYSSKFSMKLSVIWEFPDGSRLKLLLDPRSQPQDAETGLAQFLGIVKMKSDVWRSRGGVNALGGQDAVVTGPLNEIEIWVFNPELNRLESVDPWGSE
jgi:hypothetical protein